MLSFSIGIMAYNEGKNIGKLLETLQKDSTTFVSEIFVVASGCSDNTETIVKEFAKKDPRIKLLVQEKREGKSSAINLWLKNTNAQILILESADTLPAENSLEKLLDPFKNEAIGMTGGRPVPVNNPKTFLGFAVHLLWNLHHQISLNNPKLGETVAFRRIFDSIPASSSVDEAAIENIVRKKGYQIQYVGDAIIYNKGPENVLDFITQRRRIYAGHLAIKQNEAYKVATMNTLNVLFALKKNFKFNLRFLFFTPGVIALEACGRFLGWYDFALRKKEATIWKIAKSTKDPRL